MTVTFDEFKKLDLRIGQVTQVDPHPDADKLYLVKIDIGAGEIKQSVAGLKPHFTPEQLMNKTVAVVANIQPTKLRGIESQCMILAATAGDKVVLLVPETDVPSGSKVS